jgi:hypothetical protein
MVCQNRHDRPAGAGRAGRLRKLTDEQVAAVAGARAPRGLDLLPGRVRILPAAGSTGHWAPRGQTPVLTHRFSWKRLSMSGALAYRPDRTEPVFVFGIKEGAYNTASLIEFLTALHDHLDG